MLGVPNNSTNNIQKLLPPLYTACKFGQFQVGELHFSLSREDNDSHIARLVVLTFADVVVSKRIGAFGAFKSDPT